MTSHRHRYEFNFGPPSPEQLRFLEDIARRMGQEFTAPETHAEAKKRISLCRSSGTMGLDERIALREALEERARRRATGPCEVSA